MGRVESSHSASESRSAARGRSRRQQRSARCAARRTCGQGMSSVWVKLVTIWTQSTTILILQRAQWHGAAQWGARHGGKKVQRGHVSRSVAVEAESRGEGREAEWEWGSASGSARAKHLSDELRESIADIAHRHARAGHALLGSNEAFADTTHAASEMRREEKRARALSTCERWRRRLPGGAESG